MNRIKPLGGATNPVRLHAGRSLVPRRLGRQHGAGAGELLGNRMRPEPQAEFFDRAAVPPEIAELWEEWRELDPGTAKMIRAAVMSRSPRQLRCAWAMLAARAELARAARVNGRNYE